MSFTQTFSLWVRTALQRIQSKLSFEGWSAYPQFSTDKVRDSDSFVCIQHHVSHLVLGSRSRGHVGMYIGHSIRNTRTSGASNYFASMGNTRITTSGRSTRTRTDAATLAVVHVRRGGVHLSLIGILCHCRVQSHRDYLGLVLNQSFRRLHGCRFGKHTTNEVVSVSFFYSYIHQLYTTSSRGSNFGSVFASFRG